VPGAPGFQGVPGFAGPTGVPGVSGAQGVPGPTGPTGVTGAPGFQGVPGPTGPTGVPGAQGPQGAQGATGSSGVPGAQGRQGAPGPTGPTGVPGAQGIVGALGTQATALGVNTAAGPTGTLRATSDIVAGFSDVRLKDNIEYIKEADKKLYSLSAIFYKQNELSEKFGYHTYKTEIGVIAQEVQKILPEIVSLAPFDIDENGNSKSGQNYLTVQYQFLIPLIVETIKIQQKEIEILREKLNGN
jgi:hypothetical protein